MRILSFTGLAVLGGMLGCGSGGANSTGASGVGGSGSSASASGAGGAASSGTGGGGGGMIAGGGGGMVTGGGGGMVTSGAGGGGMVTGVSGGTLATLSFAVVGDTRPALIDDTATYPKAIIQKIWQDIEAASPRPAFAVTTGDYMFAKPYGSQSIPQLDMYLSARTAYSNAVFPAMGNHECTGATASNCGPGGADGVTANYTNFLSKMLSPFGLSEPYYTLRVAATDNSWTAKFVFIAANAWTQKQSSWLAGELAKPTTYTFVVRHESKSANTAPGVTPSEQIIAQHPLTLLIAGHTHTFAYYKSEKAVIVGNGGAPLTGGVDYGYVIGRQRADGAIEFKEYDYSTNALHQTFAVKADGTPTP